MNWLLMVFDNSQKRHKWR